MAKILVTGGSGFLGSHIADALTTDGHDVHILDKVHSTYIQESQTYIEGDITDAAFVDQVVEGFDYVYHLAALADLNEAKNKPADTVAINILGTVNLLTAAVKHGIKRFIFGSTVYVYSTQGSFYRCSKQACEAYLEEFHRKYNLDYTVLRYGSLYGPRTDETNGVYRLLKNYMSNDEITHDGKGSDKREYIHVFDAARLSAQIMQDRYENKHYVITGNDRLEIQELYLMFGEILNKQVRTVFKDDGEGNKGHYSLTPYTYQPTIGKKLISNEYVDMGQGIINLLEEMRRKGIDVGA